jgi:hypothetical protein
MTERGILKAYALADEARERAIADLLAFYQLSEAERARGRGFRKSGRRSNLGQRKRAGLLGASEGLPQRTADARRH